MRELYLSAKLSLRNIHGSLAGIAATPWIVVLFLAGFTQCPVVAQGTLSNGGMHLGAILPAGETDSWTFAATAGARITVRVGEISQINNFTPRIRLINPSGNQQATGVGATAAEVSVIATNTGTFTVEIDGVQGNATGEYRLSLANIPATVVVSPGDEGGPLTNGVMHTGVIDVGDIDVWTFDASAGEALTIGMGETQSIGTFTPALWFYGPDGRQLDFSYGTAAAQVTFRATNSGTFTIVAGDYSSGFSGSGPYRLTLAKTGDPVVISAADEGGPMTNGVTHLGTIDLGDIDVWTFDASAGEALTIGMGETQSIGTFTPALWFYGPDGRQLDFSYGTVAAQVTFRATNSGTFTIVAGDYSSGFSGSGPYRLTLAKTGDPVVISAADEGGPMTNGVTHLGTIDLGDIDVWTFDASAGEALTIGMGETQSIGTFTPALWFYGPDGRQLDFSYGTVAAQVTFRATNSGTFTIVAGDYSSGFSGSGPYRLTLAKTGDPVVISAADEGGPMTNGVTHLGTIDLGDIDVWTFDASAGEALTIGMGETQSIGTFTPALWFYGPDGRQLDFSYGTAAAQVTFRATNSGTFTIVAGDYSSGFSGSGPYRLTLTKTGSPIIISPGDEGGPLTNGIMHTGVIQVGDVDVWSFDAKAGESLAVAMGERESVGTFTPALWFYGPDGRQLDFSYGTVAAQVTFRATNSGTFTVVVGDYSSGFAGNGPYRLTLAKTGTPVFVSDGDQGGRLNGADEYDGAIDAGDLDVWSFTLCAGDFITVRMDEASAGSSLTPWLRLFGRDGTLQRTVSGTASTEFSIRATNSGTFVVVAGDFSSGYAGSGPYHLTVNGLSHDLRLCVPRVRGTNVTVSGVGGEPDTDFVILTSPLVEAPLSTWTPIFTNQFDGFGTFIRTNDFPLGEPRRFFILKQE